MHTFIRRKTDGLMDDHQNGDMPSVAGMALRLQNAVARFGGAADDYEVIAVDDSDIVNWNHKDRLYALANGIIDRKSAPVLTTSKNQIQADGVDVATISITVGDGAHNGAGFLIIRQPDDSSTRQAVAFENGAIAVDLSTEQVGDHWIGIDSDAFGYAEIKVEGIL